VSTPFISRKDIRRRMTRMCHDKERTTQIDVLGRNPGRFAHFPRTRLRLGMHCHLPPILTPPRGSPLEGPADSGRLTASAEPFELRLRRTHFPSFSPYFSYFAFFSLISIRARRHRSSYRNTARPPSLPGNGGWHFETSL